MVREVSVRRHFYWCGRIELLPPILITTENSIWQPWVLLLKSASEMAPVNLPLLRVQSHPSQEGWQLETLTVTENLILCGRIVSSHRFKFIRVMELDAWVHRL